MAVRVSHISATVSVGEDVNLAVLIPVLNDDCVDFVEAKALAVGTGTCRSAAGRVRRPFTQTSAGDLRGIDTEVPCVREGGENGESSKCSFDGDHGCCLRRATDDVSKKSRDCLEEQLLLSKIYVAGLD